MTADLHEIRNYLNDMRICFIILTGGSVIAVCCYVLVTFLRLSRARHDIVASLKPKMVEEAPDYMMNDVKVDGNQYKQSWPVANPSMNRPPKTRLADVFFNPEDMRYHRRCSMKPTTALSMGHAPPDEMDSENEE